MRISTGLFPLLMYAPFALFYSAMALAEEYTDLPAPPRAMPSLSESVYYLTLSVNGQSDNTVVPVTYRAGNYYVDAEVLRQNHVRLPQQSTGLVSVSTLPEVTADYDQAIQQLQLTVPTLWLPEQSVEGGGQDMAHLPARSSPGLLFNYNLYYTSPAAIRIHSAVGWNSAFLAPMEPYPIRGSTILFRAVITRSKVVIGVLIPIGAITIANA
ncbi:hypothetical protein [Pectobacterium wasabiae]|uniref:hypothetical protein n=1 Tax=Pectobacterium wasabiae TaxID=55208 RepID=UPI000A8FB2D9|nr:hypothetical protein [Pectobacterium wasabiae]